MIFYDSVGRAVPRAFLEKTLGLGCLPLSVRSRSQEGNPLGCNGFDQLSFDQYAHGEGIYLAGIHLQTSPFELESICLDLNK